MYDLEEKITPVQTAHSHYRCLKFEEHGTREKDEGVLGYVHAGNKCRSRAGQAPEQGKRLCYQCLKFDEHRTGEED